MNILVLGVFSEEDYTSYIPCIFFLCFHGDN